MRGALKLDDDKQDLNAANDFDDSMNRNSSADNLENSFPIKRTKIFSNLKNKQNPAATFPIIYCGIKSVSEC